MTQPAKSQEPSMEEILASIRRIIADDDANKTPAEPPKAEPRKAEPRKAEASPAPPPMAPPAAFSAPVSHSYAEPAYAEPAYAEPEPAVKEEPPEAMAVADQAADILDLTESMATPAPPPVAAHYSPPQFRTIDGSSDLDFDETSVSSPAPDVTSAPIRSGEGRGHIVSSETSAAVDSAFNALAQTVLAQNARTVEDLVREMLRPMLKTWLDDNLPSLVERLVRAEIERVSRGRAG
jgi:uncharacterized protein